MCQNIVVRWGGSKVIQGDYKYCALTRPGRNCFSTPSEISESFNLKHMKRLFRKFKHLLGYKYYISCRTHIGYMSSGPFTLKQAKQQYRECKSWHYTDIEIVHNSRIIF